MLKSFLLDADLVCDRLTGFSCFACRSVLESVKSTISKATLEEALAFQQQISQLSARIEVLERAMDESSRCQNDLTAQR